MSNIKISVVVPMYNSAKYLTKCLESLKAQTMKELEYVLVNDGSTDDTLNIANSFLRSDKRFKIIDKKNTGYGDSVNQGIRLAKGEYIGIVEPDDFCSELMFETLYNLVRTHDADIGRGNYYYYSNRTVQEKEPLYKDIDEIAIDPLKKYEVFFEPPAIWAGIYKKSFLKKNNISFLSTPGASYQDAGFSFKALACAKRVSFINRPLYYYRIDNPDSSVKDFRKTLAVVGEYHSIEDFVGRMDQKELLLKYCQVAKFGAYHWNLLRLKNKETRRFMKTMKQEFRVRNKEGLLERRFFPMKYWVSLRALLILPIALYWMLFEIRKLMRRV